MPLDQGQHDEDHDAGRPLFGARSDQSMPLGDHLEELRHYIILAVIGVAVAFFVALPFGFRLIAWIAQPLISAMSATGYPPQTYVTEPTAGFTSVYLPVCFITAMIVSAPWVLLQLWRFISVGLYEYERKAVYLLVPFSTAMTALGVAFTYYIMLPVALMFFLNLAQHYPEIEPAEPGPVMEVFLKMYGVAPAPEVALLDPADAVIPVLPVLSHNPDALVDGMQWIDGPSRAMRMVIDGKVVDVAMARPQLMTPLPKIDEYIRFAAYMGLGVVCAFQLPVLMLVVGWTGLIDPELVAKGRKYALFVCVCLGGVLTPTDILSMVVLSVPLYGLFELGLALMRWADRRRDGDPDPAE